MAKRQNRVPPIEHERRQLQNLKILEPNTTPERYRELSDTLVEVAYEALRIVRMLETGEEPYFQRFYDLVDELADTVPD